MGRKLAFAAVAALLLAGCGASEPEASAPPAAAPAGNGPDIAGQGVNGKALDVASFRGKPVFVNVWSSW